MRKKKKQIAETDPQKTHKFELTEKTLKYCLLVRWRK